MIAKRAYMKMMTDSYSMFPLKPLTAHLLLFYWKQSKRVEKPRDNIQRKEDNPPDHRKSTAIFHLRQPKLWFGENFGICHFRKIFNKCQHKTSIVYIDWAFNLKSTWLMNLVPDSKITATQKIVDKRYTISHIFTWALNDFWIVKRLSIGIPLKNPKNRTQHRLEFWSRPQHYNNETESKTKQYFQIFF